MKREYTGYKLFKTVKNEKEFFKYTDSLYDDRRVFEFRRLIVNFYEDELHVFWSRRTLPLKILPYIFGLTGLLFLLNLVLYSYLIFGLSILFIVFSLYNSYKLKKYCKMNKMAMLIFDGEFNKEFGTNYSWN